VVVKKATFFLVPTNINSQLCFSFFQPLITHRSTRQILLSKINSSLSSFLQLLHHLRRYHFSVLTFSLYFQLPPDRDWSRFEKFEWGLEPNGPKGGSREMVWALFFGDPRVSVPDVVWKHSAEVDAGATVFEERVRSLSAKSNEAVEIGNEEQARE
jgi:hypothetical protein